MFLALKCGQAGPLGFKFVKLMIRGAALQVPLSKLTHSPCLWFAKSMISNLRRNL